MRLIAASLALVISLLLAGCGTAGKLDNVLTLTLADSKPRAFLNSTYWSLSIGAELREQDAQALADLLQARQERDLLLRWVQSQQAAGAQAKPRLGGS